MWLSFGLGLSPLSWLIDRVRPSRWKDLGLPRFEDDDIEFPWLSYSTVDASDTSDLDGNGVFGF